MCKLKTILKVISSLFPRNKYILLEKSNEETKDAVMNDNAQEFVQEHTDVTDADDKSPLHESKAKLKRGRPAKTRWDEQEEVKKDTKEEKVEEKMETEVTGVETMTLESMLKPKQVPNNIDHKWKVCYHKLLLSTTYSVSSSQIWSIQL